MHGLHVFCGLFLIYVKCFTGCAFLYSTQNSIRVSTKKDIPDKKDRSLWIQHFLHPVSYLHSVCVYIFSTTSNAGCSLWTRYELKWGKPSRSCCIELPVLRQKEIYTFVPLLILYFKGVTFSHHAAHFSLNNNVLQLQCCQRAHMERYVNVRHVEYYWHGVWLSVGCGSPC